MAVDHSIIFWTEQALGQIAASVSHYCSHMPVHIQLCLQPQAAAVCCEPSDTFQSCLCCSENIKCAFINLYHVHQPESVRSQWQGSHLREKTAFFKQKKSRLRKSENAARLLYAKNSDLTHQNAFSLFVFCTQQRRFVEHLLWV